MCTSIKLNPCQISRKKLSKKTKNLPQKVQTFAQKLFQFFKSRSKKVMHLKSKKKISKLKKAATKSQ